MIKCLNEIKLRAGPCKKDFLNIFEGKRNVEIQTSQSSISPFVDGARQIGNVKTTLGDENE
jgi:hypothetical protein